MQENEFMMHKQMDSIRFYVRYEVQIKMNYNLLVESSARSIDHLIKIKYFTCTLKYAIVIIIDKLSLNDKLKKNRKGECTQLHTYTKRFINYLMEIKIHKNVNCISIRSDFRIHNETAVRIANWEEKPN